MDFILIFAISFILALALTPLARLVGWLYSAMKAADALGRTRKALKAKS